MNLTDPESPRVKRGRAPKGLRKSNYREKALPQLIADFGNRCGYSMVHRAAATSEREIEVDHFNPKLPEATRNQYSNLFPALAICNGCKSDTWPTKKERLLGLRFLNPTKELDYGKHIFEHPSTNLLGGIGPAAVYHIRHMGLNDPDLVALRARRNEIKRLSRNLCVSSGEREPWAELLQVVRFLAELLAEQVPEIPPPPPDSKVIYPEP